MPEKISGLDLLFASLPTGKSREPLARMAKETRIVERGPVDRVLEHPEADYTKRLLADTPSLETALAVAE